MVVDTLASERSNQSGVQRYFNFPELAEVPLAKAGVKINKDGNKCLLGLSDVGLSDVGLLWKWVSAAFGNVLDQAGHKSPTQVPQPPRAR